MNGLDCPVVLLLFKFLVGTDVTLYTRMKTVKRGFLKQSDKKILQIGLGQNSLDCYHDISAVETVRIVCESDLTGVDIANETIWRVLGISGDTQSY